MKIENMNALRKLYTEIDNKYNRMREELNIDNWDDETFDAFRDEKDEYGYPKHILCDEIWNAIDYVAQDDSIYRIDFTFNGASYETKVNNEIDSLKMLFVNMIWDLLEIGEVVNLNGEDIRSINRRIEF